MTTQTLAQSARSSSILSLGTLAAGYYIASSAIDLSATIPLDVTIELECNPNGTPSGNKQLILFAKLSLDNTNWSTGPESGNTSTEEGDLFLIGTMSTNDTNDHRKQFSLYGLPTARYLKIVVKNDLGVALTSGDVYMATITGSNS